MKKNKELSSSILKKHALSLIAFFSIVITIEILGSFFTFASVKTWYPLLTKPFWNPPAYVFGPVWTVLYVMIAISGWLVYIQKVEKKKKKRALTLYGLQLFFNFIWSFLFFYLQSPLLGMIDIFLLLAALFGAILAFSSISKVATWLLIPYLLWTIYAMTLNVALWRLN